MATQKPKLLSNHLIEMKIKTENSRPSLSQIVDMTRTVAKNYMRKNPESIIDIEKKPDGWKVTIETIERKSIPDTQDLMGRYDILFNNNGELIGWKQKMIRKRSDKTESSETKEE
jgi:phage gpG-like protein